MDIETCDRLPLVPEATLKAHKVHVSYDTRFRACARLLQALHRQAAGWTLGTYTTASGRKRRMGHLVGSYDGAAGANFLSLDVHRLARRELAYREPGAMFEERRLYENLLSSTPLALNLLGPLKLNRDLAEAFVREIAPEYAGRVCAVGFEHSPGRGDRTFTDDATAFDGFINLRLEDGRKAFIAIEIKYSETAGEPEPRMRDRYDDLSVSSELFSDPDDPALRRNPIQQFWRLHLLAQSMIDAGLYDAGKVVVIAPRLNDQVQRALGLYQRHLAPAREGKAGFLNLPLEDAISALALAGAPDMARAITTRYVDFTPIHALI
ncbi:MAG: hypothetical protein U1C74_31985 [Phenylobacterium sp.]|uniref:PGN_0703 family putative restriction endonuclease n=1 Tax=Brevundimonas sp. TaxID=1871086 RepID=UPI002737F063|nr:hypothetical protein [Brevundimonas sp.]MDP3803477.1 hypothetical protein [Brevundimonas sp.]MDZ4376024.1 hypothetical protein [Phenylobacterium sp.]